MRNMLICIILVISFNMVLQKGYAEQTLSVGISPYQDIAMIVNIHSLGLDKKYGVNVNLHTMAWEDILPSVASRGKTVDVGFGSLVEYLTKENNLNKGVGDPVLFIYPAYVYKGGAFITFTKDIVRISKNNINDNKLINQFISYKIGVQKNSIYEMMIFSLAKRIGRNIGSVKIYDTPLNDGIWAAQSGSLDISAAGLTQITEAKKLGGRIVLTMDDMGFSDITGFICKKSILDTKREEIEKLIIMWFECVSYVMTNIDLNSSNSLKYLRENASTKYTLEQYKTALSQEYFPLNIGEADKSIGKETGNFSYIRIANDVSDYLLRVGIVKERPNIPEFIKLGQIRKKY